MSYSNTVSMSHDDQCSILASWSAVCPWTENVSCHDVVRLETDFVVCRVNVQQVSDDCDRVICLDAEGRGFDAERRGFGNENETTIDADKTWIHSKRSSIIL